MGQVSVYLGQSLPAGTPVATVTDLRQIEVQASVPAKRIQQVQVGQAATILWGNESASESLPGKVTFVGQEIEPGSGSFPVVIVGENPDERLRAGLHVQARIVARHLENVLAVPQSAILEETDEPFLFLAVKDHEPESGKHEEKQGNDNPEKNGANDKHDEKGKPNDGDKDTLIARKVPVKILVRNGDLVQVEGEGITEGALVVTDRSYFLADKARLEIDAGEQKKEPEK